MTASTITGAAAAPRPAARPALLGLRPCSARTSPNGPAAARAWVILVVTTAFMALTAANAWINTWIIANLPERRGRGARTVSMVPLDNLSAPPSARRSSSWPRSSRREPHRRRAGVRDPRLGRVEAGLAGRHLDVQGARRGIRPVAGGGDPAARHRGRGRHDPVRHPGHRPDAGPGDRCRGRDRVLRGRRPGRLDVRLEPAGGRRDRPRRHVPADDRGRASPGRHRAVPADLDPVLGRRPGDGRRTSASPPRSRGRCRCSRSRPSRSGGWTASSSDRRRGQVRSRRPRASSRWHTRRSVGTGRTRSGR